MLQIVLFFWSGYGFIVPVIVFVNSILAELLSEAIFEDENFYQENLFPMALGFIISGLLLFLLQRFFARQLLKGKGTYIFDKITLQKRSTFFFIAVNIWVHMLIILGGVIIIIQLFR